MSRSPKNLHLASFLCSVESIQDLPQSQTHSTPTLLLLYHVDVGLQLSEPKSLDSLSTLLAQREKPTSGL